MLNIDFHSEAVWQGLALHRYHIHLEEVKRVLTPVLEEVYRVGYDRGTADNYNAVEGHHEHHRLCDVTAEEAGVTKSEELRELTAEEMNRIEPNNYFPVEDQHQKTMDESYYKMPGSA